MIDNYTYIDYKLFETILWGAVIHHIQWSLQLKFIESIMYWVGSKNKKKRNNYPFVRIKQAKMEGK